MIEHNYASENVTKSHYAPFITPEKYAELAGFSVEAVRIQVQKGKLPVLHRSGDNSSRRTLINMLAIERLAVEQATNHQEWISAF